MEVVIATNNQTNFSAILPGDTHGLAVRIKSDKHMCDTALTKSVPEWPVLHWLQMARLNIARSVSKQTKS
jgi:hypothetical protein